MKKKRWKFTKGKNNYCHECECLLDKRYYDDEEEWCSVTCHMHGVGMSWSDFI